MKRFFIGLVLVSFLVACGSTPPPLPIDRKVTEDPPKTPEQVSETYIGDFTMKDAFKPETRPNKLAGSIVLTLKADGSIVGTAQKTSADTGSGWIKTTDSEEGVITGKITKISEFGSSGELELKIVFPTSGSYAGKTSWTKVSGYFVAEFIEGDIGDESFIKRLDIRVLNERFLE